MKGLANGILTTAARILQWLPIQTFRSVTTINTAKDDTANDQEDGNGKEEDEEECYGTPLVTSMDLVEEELANMSVSDVVASPPGAVGAGAAPTAMTSLISPTDKGNRPKVSLIHLNLSIKC